MAVALSNSSSEPSSTRLGNSHKVARFNTTILEAKQNSNMKDQYTLGEQLGWGQFGVIRECTDKSTGEILACKSIAKDRLVTSDDVRSIKLEIEIMTRLSGHPNVVDLKAVYEEEDHVHLVMELCAGGELFHKLEKHGKFSECEARVLFRHLMQVVLYCHENGVVHRDLKPENILLATKASSSPIKLADFGLATYIKPGHNLHGLVGSPFYIAPEVLAGGYNQAVDVWSAGVILYILLSGIPPFWGKTKSRIFDAVRLADLRFPSNPWDHISESATDLIKRMLCTDPSRRLTAQQVLDHSWMTTNELKPEQPSRFANRNCGAWDEGGCSISSPFMPRNQDLSFGDPSPIDSDNTQSPALTCRSSFSSFLVEPSTPCLALGGFSFRSCADSIGIGSDIASPILSMPSFAFFSPVSVVKKANYMEEVSANTSRVDAIHEDSSLEKLLMLSRHLENNNPSEVKRAGLPCWSRIAGIHSKRNHTIGLGEHEKLDLIVTESVIRSSSCTQLPASFRSFLVC